MTRIGLENAVPYPCSTIVLTIAMLGLCRVAAAGEPADWPHVRGPTYDAIAPAGHLANSWPAGGPAVLWVRDLGQGYSGFVIANGRAFTQVQSRTGQFVIALDAATGTEVWRTRVDWPWQPAGEYPGPYASPTLHDGRLYFATPAGLVGCLTAADGGALWSVNVRETFQGTGTEFGYAATPLLEAGRVFLPVGGPDASVVALDAATGATIWAAGEDAASYCPAFPITVGGRRLIVAYMRNCIVAHDPATGLRAWRIELSAAYDEHAAWPLYREPDLWISAPFKVGSRLLRLGSADPRSIWESKALSNDVCSSVLVCGHIYGFDLQQLQASANRTSRGRFKCLDFATGAVRWETDRIGHATVLAADGKLYLLTDTGTLILARVSADAYEELGRAKVLDGGIGWTPPALWNDRLFIRNQSRAACVYVGPADRLDAAARTPVSTPAGEPFDWGRLLTHEPDFPHDAPTSADVGRWFAWCVGGVFGGAAAVAGLVWLIARAMRSARPRSWAGGAFVVAAMLIGLAGTTVFSAWADVFVLTWPPALYAVFRLTLGVVVWAEARPGQRGPRLAARAAVLLLVAVCYGYYRLCLEVGYTMAWAFLAGFLPAAPCAVVAARTRRWWVGVLADAAGFGVYFWMSGLLPGWKDRWLG
jgi:outer membrane protein assembly factor BamB